jgi:cellulose biosynthesis protein BcsQ
VVDASPVPGPGVIAVVPPDVYEILNGAGASWRLQERQASVADMWAGLSGGRLDPRSRILVFSDCVDAADELGESTQTARAVVAMAKAGAHVFIATGDPDRRARLEADIAAATAAQGVTADALTLHWVPGRDGAQALLGPMREVLGSAVAWPEPAAPPSPDVPSVPPAEPPAASAPGGVPVPPRIGLAGAHPSLPPIGTEAPVPPHVATGYPPSASMELLERPKVPGQVTITVTSSKGGSGKSTASILLAGSIARASRDAGHPLSVCLIDLDTRDGQVASLIGKFMPTALNIRVQPVWDEERIRRNLVHADGVDVDCLLAPIRPRTADTVGPDFYKTIVRSLQRMYDVVVMDTSVQYLEPLIAEVALGESDEILFVTTLASTAVQGMARALREITAPVEESGLGVSREKIGIIVNQSVANVGMERDQVLAAGLGVPVVGVIPLATKDVLTATNLNRMYALLDHPLLGPAYNELAQACLPGRALAPWSTAAAPDPVPVPGGAGLEEHERKRGLFRR